MTQRIQMTGRRFGRVIVTGLSRTVKSGNCYRVLWKCLCDCGTEKEIDGCSLRSGRTQSCGCFHRGMVGHLFRTHGHCVNATLTVTYIAWASMIARCTNRRNKRFVDYGGRGITVCERWRNSYENFLADMGERPSGMTIDRIDNNGNYEPGNCHWATRMQQGRNKRNNHIVTANGVSRCISEWAVVLGCRPSTIHQRLRYGWKPDIAVTTPVRS